jgi:hypothetical protein
MASTSICISCDTFLYNAPEAQCIPMLALSAHFCAFSRYTAHYCIPSHTFVFHCITLRIIALHHLSSRIAYPCPTTSLVHHISCLMVVTSIAVLLHVITYYQHVFFLFLLHPMQFCLVYSLMIALLLSLITPLYCTSLTIGFYSEVVVTIRVHFLLPMVIVIGLD